MNDLVLSSNTQYLNKISNTLNKTDKVKKQSSNSISTNVNKTTNLQNKTAGNQTILAKKGQAGYIKDMDLDEDGQVTFEEFNEYCENNGISAQDKLKMATAIIAANKDSKVAKDTAKIASENEKENKNKDDNKNEDNAVYAKEGDEKYDEAMDENGNGVVTYAEYLKYINEESLGKNEDSKVDDKNETSSNAQETNNKITESYEPQTETDSLFEFEA